MSETDKREEEPADAPIWEHIDTGKEIVENAAEAAEAEKGLDWKDAPGVGLMTGAAGVGLGIKKMVQDPSVDAGLQLAQAANTTVRNGANLVGATKVADKLGPVGTVLDGASTVNDIRNGDWAGAARDGTATVLGVAAPELAAPWKVGWAAGTGIKNWTEGVAKERGYFGKGRTMQDHANDVGDAATELTGSRLMGGNMAASTKLTDTIYTAEHWALDKVGIDPTSLPFMPGSDGPSAGAVAGSAATGSQLVHDVLAKGGDPAMIKTQLTMLSATVPEARAALAQLEKSPSPSPSPFAHYAD